MPFLLPDPAMGVGLHERLAAMADESSNESTVVEAPAENETTDSQGSLEALGDAGKKALQAEREARRHAETEKRALEARLVELTDRVEVFEAGNRSEIENARIAAERLEAAKQEAETKAAEAEARLLRYEVAQEKGLTGDALNLLTGSTRDELEAKADSILALIEQRVSAPPVVKQEGHSPEQTSGAQHDFANAMRSLFK